MRGIDLARTPFDFDLTFAVLLMHPDGHVYHRYGGRDERGANVWLSQDSFRSLLTATLEEHDAYSAQPDPPPRPARLVIEEMPSFKKRDKGECVHCHSVFPAFYEEARDAGEWTEDDRWVYPPPGRIGIDLDRDDQACLTAVATGSPAAAAGLAVGDRLLRVGAQRTLTSSDLSQALHDAAPGEGALRVQYERAGEVREASLALSGGWKRGTTLEFSWRPLMWGFTPAPGFGGKQLDSDQLRALGLAPDAFAFRVDYLVTWGETQRYGREAWRAGLRDDDIFVSAAGKQDFASVGHFHAWWRLTREVGEAVTVEVLRRGQRLAFELEVLR